uniref:Uncharacterized protein n=1 Tax=Avena sativa TaxID=4498 RepID=A0ACD5XC71_AVESA
MVSVMFVGHLGELPLAGASLATSVASATGFCLFIGMSSALDTLCGQAFGARQYHLLGIYMQSAMVVLALACVPVALVWANTTKILLFLGQDEAIAAEAGAYARWLIPSLVPYVPLACHIRFLQAQSIVLPVMASSAVTALAHVLVCWALVHRAGMGSRGAALSNTVSSCVNLAILALYVRVSSACRQTWTGFSMEAFKELRRFTELAVPLEQWSFELLVLLSGLLPNPALETSVLSICLNTGDLIFMVASGLCTAISTRVSNELGAGHPQAAKRATKVVICMALSEGLVIAIAMILLRNSWGYVYSNEQDVVSYIARMIPISRYIILHRWPPQFSVGCANWMWQAEDRCTCQPRRILLGRHSHGGVACICPPSEWNGSLARYRLRKHDQAFVPSVDHNVYKLGERDVLQACEEKLTSAVQSCTKSRLPRAAPQRWKREKHLRVNTAPNKGQWKRETLFECMATSNTTWHTTQLMSHTFAEDKQNKCSVQNFVFLVGR